MNNKKISTKKLKAIVFTDIVNFTKISAEDEESALQIIDKQRDLLKPIVLENEGEWLKEIGDGLLFSFDSSINAVRCSMQIQQTLKDIDDFKIRIGIHQGDIFIKGGDIYGDDVNIASRVEGFSPIGGISISDKVYKDIQGIKDIETAFIGHKPLKGVSQETKVRCIISNDLPKDKGNLLPKIIGNANLYFGTLIIFVFSLMSILIISNPESAKVGIPVDEKWIIPLIIFAFFNLGLILVLFGYSTLSFHKGISIKSQKFIYYLSIFYILLMFIWFGGHIKIVNLNIKSDSGELLTVIIHSLSWIASIFIYTIPLIIFKIVQKLYKYIILR